jgi:hypothetical protein
MQYFLKQAVHLGGKDYQRGINELPEKAENDPFFLKCINSGLVTEVEPAKVVAMESFQDRQKKLADKLIAKASAAKQAREQKVVDQSEEHDAEEVEEDFIGKTDEPKKKGGRPKKVKED